CCSVKNETLCGAVRCGHGGLYSVCPNSRSLYFTASVRDSLSTRGCCVRRHASAMLRLEGGTQVALRGFGRAREVRRFPPVAIAVLSCLPSKSHPGMSECALFHRFG